MDTLDNIKQLLIILLIGMLSACGGIDGTGDTGDSGATTSAGRVTSTDNGVTVNGVEYTTANANITVDGEASSVSELMIGQVVVVEGSNSDGVSAATSITANTNVIGPVSTITQEGSKTLFTVLGQTVVADIATPIGGEAYAISDIQVGDVLQVSGFVLTDNTLSATRLDSVLTTSFEVTGSISLLDAGSTAFNINGLVVDYSQLATQNLSNGLKVEVRGLGFNEDGHFIATEIIDIAPIFDGAGERVELEGFVTHLTDGYSFTIGDINVIASRTLTEYEGDDARNLELDTKVEVEGVLGPDGSIYASKVIFLAARLLDFQSGDTLPGETVTFRWSDVDADEYLLRVRGTYSGTENGSLVHQYYDGSVTQVTIDGLPRNGARLFVNLYTRHESLWTQKFYILYGQNLYPISELISHEDKDQLGSGATLFRWEDVGAEAYRIQIRDEETTFFDQVFTDQTEVSVADLPENGADLFVSLWTRHGDWWAASRYQLLSPQLFENAEMLSHNDRARLTSNTETFVWSDVGAEAYDLRISQYGGAIYRQRFDGDVTSVEVSDLPLNNAIFLVRLSTLKGGWARRNYLFYGAGLIPESELNSHEEGSQISSLNEIFTWTEIPQAVEYRVSVFKSDPDGNKTRVFDQYYDNYTTFDQIDNLPRNSAVFEVVLRTNHNGFWANRYYDISGTGELADAEIISHEAREVIQTSSTTFHWSDVRADQYRLIVEDRTAGVVLHDESYSNVVTNQLISNLPQSDHEIKVSLYSLHDGWWGYTSLYLHSGTP